MEVPVRHVVEPGRSDRRWVPPFVIIKSMIVHRVVHPGALAVRRAALFLLLGLGAALPPAAAQVDAARIVHAVARLQRTELLGRCSGTIAADRAVIYGGVSAETLKPGQADQEIDAEIDAIEKLVAPLGGTVRVRERLRAVRGEGPSSFGRNPPPKPFIAVQRLEIEVPAGTDVDPLLDRLLVAGFDRFGRSVEVEASHRASPVVAYQFTGVEAELEALVERCRGHAFDAWCGLRPEDDPGAAPFADPPGDAVACRHTLDALTPFFRLTRMQVLSEPVADAQGRVQPVQLVHPWQKRQIDALEVLTPEPITVHGTMGLRFELPQP